MGAELSSDFADFLEERLSKALFLLREKNEEYSGLIKEYNDLLHRQYHSIDEYRQAFVKIADAHSRMSDIEKHFLFLMGMREQAGLVKCLFSESFEKEFFC